MDFKFRLSATVYQPISYNLVVPGKSGYFESSAQSVLVPINEIVLWFFETPMRGYQTLDGGFTDNCF
jgi:hypothetical protein